LFLKAAFYPVQNIGMLAIVVSKIKGMLKNTPLGYD
jgi:hypothetical protein